MVIIVLDILLFAMIIRVYLFTDKKDLRRVKPDKSSMTATRSLTLKLDELKETTAKKQQGIEKEDEEEKNNRDRLREYFRTTSKWNIAIDVISVIILLVELVSTSLEKAGVIHTLSSPSTSSTTQMQI